MIRSLSNSGSPVLPSGASTPNGSSLHGHPLPSTIDSALGWTRRLPSRVAAGSRAGSWRTVVVLLLLGALLGRVTPSPSGLFARRPPPFYVPSDLFLPPPPLPPNPAFHPPPPILPADGAAPNVVHYVYGYKPPKAGEEEGELMPYYTYLAIRSAIVNLKPDAIYFHYWYLPRGPFFDLLKPHLTLLRTPAPDEIYGRKLDHFAHKADVVRLQALQYTGGIYLDIDVYVTRSFDKLLPFGMVMGMEASPNSDRGPLDPEGLCNAVIVARNGTRFIERWLETYVNFNGGDWAGHSVRKPWELARRFPEEITVLNERAFFWPLWEGSGEASRIRYVHEELTHSFAATGQFAYHSWESLAMPYLTALTPASVRQASSSFTRMCREFMDPVEDERAFMEWERLKRATTV